MQKFRIIVDADACPRSCLQIIEKLAVKHHYEVITVASFNHQINTPHHLTVGNEPQATDMALINLACAGDIIVTQDWGLAAIALAKQTKVISPAGKVFQSETIDFLLEERALLAKHRRSGVRTKGPAKRSQADDQNFELNFLKLLNEKC